MKPFTLTHKAGPFGDETSLYELVLTKPITVDEFLDYILKELSNEWGYVDVGHNRVEYRYGKIISGHLPLQDTVIGGTADGGWTRMDYNLKVK